jgi:hypothetical protein
LWRGADPLLPRHPNNSVFPKGVSRARRARGRGASPGPPLRGWRGEEGAHPSDNPDMGRISPVPKYEERALGTRVALAGLRETQGNLSRDVGTGLAGHDTGDPARPAPLGGDRGRPVPHTHPPGPAAYLREPGRPRVLSSRAGVWPAPPPRGGRGNGRRSQSACPQPRGRGPGKAPHRRTSAPRPRAQAPKPGQLALSG